MTETIDGVRTRITTALLARETAVRIAGGTILPYGFAITRGEGHDGLHLVTMSESLPLTAGLARRVASVPLWGQGSVRLVIDEVDPQLADDAAMQALHAMVLMYPTTANGRIAVTQYSSVDTVIWPAKVARIPLILLAPERPEGWPR